MITTIEQLNELIKLATETINNSPSQFQHFLYIQDVSVDVFNKYCAENKVDPKFTIGRLSVSKYVNRNGNVTRNIIVIESVKVEATTTYILAQ